MINPDQPAKRPIGSTPPQLVPRAAQRAPGQGHHHIRSGRRKTIFATCELHRGPIGFTNLLVSTRNGTIVLDPHVDGSCVISLDQDGATELCDTLTEWLG
jgi:hypothetical protein